MPVETDFEAARQAYEHAWAEAKKYGDEALSALQKANAVSSREARDLFTEKAGHALVASENWRKSAQIAIDVMQEIESGRPRGRPPG
jgi:hypothetical protein